MDMNVPAETKGSVKEPAKVKVKVNDRCPCNSGLKYKKCCANAVQKAKLDKAAEFTAYLLANERQGELSERLQSINTYFLERYNRPSVNISNIATSETLSRIAQYYSTKNIFIICERDDKTESAFTSKGAKEEENVMIIYKNRFLQFNWDTEWTAACKEIHRWL